MSKPARVSLVMSSILFAAQAVNAGTLQVLHTFQGSPDGSTPLAGLVRDAAGNFYGTTEVGGASGFGTVFRLNSALEETILYSFCLGGICENEGFKPASALLLDTAGNLYGTTPYGGVLRTNYGTVFKLSKGASAPWVQTLLYSFTGGADGWGPEAGLVAGPKGDLFGTTLGANGQTPTGVVFELAPATPAPWKETVLHTFTGGADGSGPTANLIRDSKGNFYGTTSTGGQQSNGAAGYGIVFRLTPSGNGAWNESILHTFTGPDGANPAASLTMDRQGNLYGTTAGGGCCGGGGVVFRLTPAASGPWTESVLYAFCSASFCADGSGPKAGVIMNAQGDLYGTTSTGGTTGIPGRDGVIFKLTPTLSLPWAETVVYSFTGGADGANPVANLIQDRNGHLYGTASAVALPATVEPCLNSSLKASAQDCHSGYNTRVSTHPSGILCALALLAFALPATPETVHQKRLVGDYGYWSRTQTPPYSSEQIPFHALTHINHAGVSFGADGSLTVPSGFLEPELISKAHAAGVKVMLLLGGDFPALDGNPSLRATLLTNLSIFITANGYDGLDIDWEYPASTADTDAFVGLMTGLRAVFPAPKYVLSADVPPWGGAYGYPNVQPVIDYFNVMMYDCAGPWTDDGQLNSAIFPDPNNPEPYMCEPGGTVEEAANIFLSQLNIPAAQINMGTPFYGYLYTNVSSLFGLCSPCNNNTVPSENYGTFIKQRVNKLGWKTYYDQVSLVPYMLRTDGSPGYLTYDDWFSTYYRIWYSVWKRGLGGSFLWSLDADYDGHSQDLLDAMYRATMSGQTAVSK